MPSKRGDVVLVVSGFESLVSQTQTCVGCSSRWSRSEDLEEAICLLQLVHASGYNLRKDLLANFERYRELLQKSAS